jgi:3-hydroxyisobutyrate dehydrogenase
MMQRAFARSFSSKVGFVGMGNMGLPMCHNLKKAGFQVKGYDISDAINEKANSEGIQACGSMKEAVHDADYVVTCLPKTHHVEGVLTQEDGLFATMKKGAYICDVSTISPIASAEFYKNAKDHGVNFLDTPMSGGITGAIAGTLTFMVGGEKDEFEHAKIVLDGMGKNVFHTGKPGSGEIAKIVNNMILGINMVAAAEALAIAEKMGMDMHIQK